MLIDRPLPPFVLAMVHAMLYLPEVAVPLAMLEQPPASRISTRCWARDADMLYCWLRDTIRVTVAAVETSASMPIVKITIATTTSMIVKPSRDRVRGV